MNLVETRFELQIHDKNESTTGDLQPTGLGLIALSTMQFLL